jgi:hypothetical protein
MPSLNRARSSVMSGIGADPRANISLADDTMLTVRQTDEPSFLDEEDALLSKLKTPAASSKLKDNDTVSLF